MSGPTADRERLGYSFWIGLALGTPVTAYGVWYLLHNARLTDPPQWAQWMLGVLLVHDALAVPAVLGAGWVVTRLAPAWLRPVLIVAGAVSVVTAVYAIPVVTGYGRVASNPTLLPHDYAANLAVVLAAVWLVAAGVAAWRWRRAR